MKQLVRIMIGVLALVAVLATIGCGSNDSSSSTSASGGGSSTAASQDGLGGRTVKVAFDVDDPPFSYDDDGQPTGFDVDVINAIAEDQNFKIDGKSMTFDAIIPALQAGQVDVAEAAITIKPEREKIIDFSIPYFQTGLSLVTTPENKAIAKAEDLKGRSLAVRNGSSTAMWAEALPFHDQVDIKRFVNNNDQLQAVMSGVTDAGVNDRAILQYFISQRGEGKLVLSSGLLSTENYGIAVAKGNEDILKAINEGLANITADGTYTQIYEKWLGEKPLALPGEIK